MYVTDTDGWAESFFFCERGPNTEKYFLSFASKKQVFDEMLRDGVASMVNYPRAPCNYEYPKVLNQGAGGGTTGS